MADKVFDKADLLAIYDGSEHHGDKIGTFRSRRMVGSLPPVPVYESHIVYATTTASFSEKNLWLIVEHNVHITEGGLFRLSEEHPYRQKDFGELSIMRGLANSADIMRKVFDMAAEWRSVVEMDCPAGVVFDPPAPETFGDALRATATQNGAMVDADGVIHMSESTTLRVTRDGPLDDLR